MKRGQEEIVGFVIVVVFVLIVGVIFLGFALRGERGVAATRDLDHLLESSFEVTDSCILTGNAYRERVGDLFEACYYQLSCMDGTSACAHLNGTMPALLSAALAPGSDRPVKGYQFTSSFIRSINASRSEPIFSIGAGNCTGTRRGTSDFRPAEPGAVIRSTLTVC